MPLPWLSCLTQRFQEAEAREQAAKAKESKKAGGGGGGGGAGRRRANSDASSASSNVSEPSDVGSGDDEDVPEGGAGRGRGKKTGASVFMSVARCVMLVKGREVTWGTRVGGHRVGTVLVRVEEGPYCQQHAHMVHVRRVATC